MLHFDLNLTQLFVLAFANFLFSWMWYSPLIFGKPFLKVLGIKPGHRMTEAEKKRMPMLMANGFFCSLLLVGALQVFCHSTGVTDFAQGAIVGIVAFVGFALTGSLGTLWENRSTTLILINSGLYLLTYAVYGGIIAVWH